MFQHKYQVWIQGQKTGSRYNKLTVNTNSEAVIVSEKFYTRAAGGDDYRLLGTK